MIANRLQNMSVTSSRATARSAWIRLASRVGLFTSPILTKPSLTRPSDGAGAPPPEPALHVSEVVRQDQEDLL
jgi:hypothetical protein